MTQTQKLLGAAGVVIFLILSWLVFDLNSARSEEAKRSARLIAASQDTLKVLRDSLGVERVRIAATIVQVDTLWRTRTVTLASADTAHTSMTIDTAQATVALGKGDSGLACRLTQLALKASQTECFLLRQAVKVDSQTIRVQQTALLGAQTSLTSADRTIAGLSAALAEAKKAYVCKIVFVPCPSRGVVAIFGIAGGYALAKTLH